MKNIECKVDALDMKILNIISKDARIPFRNVAELCGVSRAAIHLRVQHLIDMGIISGSSYEIDVRRLGYKTCTFIGIRLERGSMYKEVVERLREIPEVVEDNAAMQRRIYMKDLEDKARTKLGRKVKICDTARKKTVELTFEDDEDLAELLKTLVGQDIFE